MNSLAEVLKIVGFQLPPIAEQKPASPNLNAVRLVCCIIRTDCKHGKPVPEPLSTVPSGLCDAASGAEFPSLSEWKPPKKTARLGRLKCSKDAKPAKMHLSAFLKLKDEEGDDNEPNDATQKKEADDASMCSSLSGNEEMWLPESNVKRRRFIEAWEERYNRKVESPLNNETNLGNHNKPKTPKPSRVMNNRRVNCLSKCQLNSISGHKIDNVEDKIENLKILTDQLKKSIMDVREEQPPKECWCKVSLTVDSGACDTVVDPRALPGYPLKETPASKAGEAFLTAAGDPIPQLGEKEVLICIESGELRSMKAQCSIVAKPLLSVKRMTEAGQFVGFCQAGGFVVDPVTNHVDWFREGNGNYILDTWLVPYEKAGEFIDKMNKQDFHRRSNYHVHYYMVNMLAAPHGPNANAGTFKHSTP